MHNRLRGSDSVCTHVWKGLLQELQGLVVGGPPLQSVCWAVGVVLVQEEADTVGAVWGRVAGGSVVEIDRREAWGQVGGFAVVV